MIVELLLGILVAFKLRSLWYDPSPSLQSNPSPINSILVHDSFGLAKPHIEGLQNSLIVNPKFPISTGRLPADAQDTENVKEMLPKQVLISTSHA